MNKLLDRLLLSAATFNQPEVQGGAPEAPAAPPTNQGEAPPQAPPLDRTEAGSESPDASAEPADGGMIGDGDDDSRKVVVPADMPDDWREKTVERLGLEGEQAEKVLSRLKRFNGVDQVVKSWLSAEQKISSGEYRKSIDEAATEEEAAEIRKEMGIPERPDGYQLPTEFQAAEIDADDPGLKAFLEKMHSANATQAQVDAAIRAYDELTMDAQQRQLEQDKAYRMQAEDDLRAEWGNEFRSRVEILKRMAQDEDGPLPPDVMQMIATARDADGNRVLNNKKVAQFLVEVGLNHYGEGALLTGEQRQATVNREQEIMGVMRTNFDKYFNEVQSNGKTMAQELQEIRARK